MAGCGKDDIKVYKLVRETDSSLPPGWEEQPASQMRFASYRVRGPENQAADVSVVPLPGSAGQDLDNVNRWLGQLNMSPVTEGDLSKLSQDVEVGGNQAKLYDLGPGELAAIAGKARFLAAIARREGTAWFFKMSGADEMVESQKPNFIAFLKRFNFPQASGPGSGAVPSDQPPSKAPALRSAPPLDTASAGSAGSQSKPEWKIPEGWQEASPGDSLAAKFIVGDAPSRATINIARFGGNGGGLEMNINRWRRQIGLEALAPGEIEKAAKPLAVPEGKGQIIELDGTDNQSGLPVKVLGVIISLSGETWFYKITGPPVAVKEQRENFLKFIQSAKYRS